MKTVALFNNKGGVGKTTLTFHLAWMFDTLGFRTVAADLDPQANLTSMFLHEDGVEALWGRVQEPSTIYRAFRPLLTREGPLKTPDLQQISTNLSFVPGELAMSEAEDELSSQWLRSYRSNEGAFRVVSALRKLLQYAAGDHDAEIVLIDVGPNLGPLNRAAMVAADFIIIPLAPDLYSLQALQNLGPTLKRWRDEWRSIAEQNREFASKLDVTTEGMQPIGYVVQQQAIRLDRPTQAYGRWMRRIPKAYREHITVAPSYHPDEPQADPNCLATLRHYRGLMPLAQETRRPMFRLKAADGVMGGHISLVQQCYEDFRELAISVAKKCDITGETAIIP